MQKYILIASTGDRLGMLLTMLKSVNKYASDFKVVLVCQLYSAENLAAIKEVMRVEHKIFSLPEKIGMHNSKMVGLDYIKSKGVAHVVCNADDDMEFTEGTNFTKAIDKIRTERDTGFVSLGWVRHVNMLKNYKYVDVFVKQKIVYTGGGMLFDQDVTDIIVDIERENYLCDNSLWSAVIYSEGYSNYRYRGSCTIHNICRVGGRKGWIKDAITKRSDDIILGRTDLITFRHAQKDGQYNYYIPLDKDLTSRCHELHNLNDKSKE